MNTSELERLLGDVLRQHAEDAMSDTDTQTSLETLQQGIERDDRSRRRGTVAVVLAIAASVAVGALLVSSLVDGPGGTDEPAGDPDGVPSAVVAKRFLDRLAANDFEGMTSYLADDAAVTLTAPTRDRDELLRQVLWSSAAGFRIVSSECADGTGSGEVSVVRCEFDYHGLGSEQLGRGPYSDASFRITVEDGSIISAVMSNPYDTNGFRDEAWDPFGYWMATKYSEDAALMYVDWPDFTTAATGARSTALWAEHLQEYVDKFGEECDCPL
jgi:hypothetical protein